MLGAEPYHLKRVLLWSSETQVPFVSTESSRRTQMVRGQLAREQERKLVSREEFLSGLGLTARVFDIRQADQSRASRAIELLNKTNQFNTTGTRWTVEDLRALSANGGSMLGFAVRDKFTDYGIVGVVVLREDASATRVEQVVMSCRVFGLDAELAVLVEVLQRARNPLVNIRWSVSSRSCQRTNPVGICSRGSASSKLTKASGLLMARSTLRSRCTFQFNGRNSPLIPVDPPGGPCTSVAAGRLTLISTRRLRR